MNDLEYFSYDALGLAELVRTKQISSSELLEIGLFRLTFHFNGTWIFH